MDTTFLNSKNNITFRPHVFVLNLTNKIDLQK